MIEVIALSVFVRTCQIAVEASTTLLCGLVVAGIMRRMLGSEGTRRLFGGKGWHGLLRAWGVGTLLPVCSLGVIPIAREMRRSGVPSGTILAFVLAAPHINPLSLLYGLTLSEPFVILCFAAGSLVIAFSSGLIWERFFASDADDLPPGDEPMPAPGVKRLAAVAVTAAKEAVNPTMGYVLLGLVFTGLLAGLLPHGCLSMTMRHENPTSTALMTAIALPLYSGPLQGMMRLGLMFEHGNSVGAAFALFELGIGLNLGMMVWLAVLFGWRRVTLWCGFVALVTMGLGYAAEQPLYFAHEEANHTHAFDEWTRPFVGSDATWDNARHKIAQKVDILEPVSLEGLLLLIVVGAMVAVFDRAGRLEAWLTRAPPPSVGPASIWNRGVPGPVLGLAALLGLVVFSVAALYLYYPAPDEAFREILSTRAKALTAVRTGHKDEAIRQLQFLDELTRKLQVGVFIRTGSLDPQAAKLTEDYRERLEDMRDALLADKLDEAREAIAASEEAYRQCRKAYEAVTESLR